jgi:hypothetical protein
MLNREQAKKALDGVLKRHGIDPAPPPDKTECKVPHVIALAVKDPLLAPIQSCPGEPNGI